MIVKLPLLVIALFWSFSLSYPSYECLGEDVLEDNLNFIKEIIYNPYLEDGVFPKNKVEDAITFYKNNVDRIVLIFLVIMIIKMIY